MLIVIKALVSGTIVASASELAKRFPLSAGILLSIPLTSLLSAIWMQLEDQGNEKIAAMLGNVFWAHIPTLLFFVLCPMFLRAGMWFWYAMPLAMLITAVGFLVYAYVLGLFGIQLYD